MQGELAYNCTTCQVDPTCVQCQKCFQAANHEGHDVYFHRTSAGGCCDCGDVEAWDPAGFCPAHRASTGAFAVAHVRAAAPVPPLGRMRGHGRAALHMGGKGAAPYGGFTATTSPGCVCL